MCISGLASLPLRPLLAGVEGVGLIVEVGSEVTDLLEGQRVGWLSGGQGSFADYAVVEAAKAVPIPDGVDTEAAAAVLMQGVTAHYLATDTYPIRPGDPVLVHAAAAVSDNYLSRWRSRAAARSSAPSPPRRRAARAAGADHVISYDNFADEARNLTDGRGVAVVYAGVGATTFEGSLAALHSRHPGGVWDRQRSHSAAGDPRLNSADRCTSPGPRLCTTPRLPRSSAAAQRHLRLGGRDSHGQHRRPLPDHASQ